MSDDKSKPFEIRLELLRIAKDTLSENSHLKADNARDRNKHLDEAPTYSTEDIVKEAEKLNAFITKTR